MPLEDVSVATGAYAQIADGAISVHLETKSTRDVVRVVIAETQPAPTVADFDVMSNDEREFNASNLDPATQKVWVRAMNRAATVLANYSTEVVGGGPVVKETKTVTADTYTLTAEDANSYLRCTHASGCTVTVPDGVLAVDDEVEIVGTQDVITLVEDSTTINTPETLVSRKAMSVLALKCVAEDEFDLTGDLELAA